MALVMGIRQLTALLRVLQRAGVTSYTQGDLSLTFGAPLATPPVDAGETQGAGDLATPDGVFDLRSRIAEINAKYAKAHRGRS